MQTRSSACRPNHGQRRPFTSDNCRTAASPRRNLQTVTKAVAGSSPEHNTSKQQNSCSITSPLPVVAAAAAVALLWPASGAYALPEAQLQQIKQTIDKDFQQGQYYVTGNLTKYMYAPDCRFKDPTTDVKGVAAYTKAVAALFDPAVSKADLISSEVSGPNSITLRWRLEGKLKIGNLPIKPYTGTTVYTVDELSGKITGHTETWDISALDAFVSTLVPSFGAPPAPPVAK